MLELVALALFFASAPPATASAPSAPSAPSAQRVPQRAVRRVTPAAAEACAAPTTNADALVAELRKNAIERVSECKENANALIVRIEELEALLDAAETENASLREQIPPPAKPPEPTTPDQVAVLAKTVAFMKPPRAAAIVERLDDVTAAALLKKLKPDLAAAILEQLKPDRAAGLAAGLIEKKS